MVIWNLLDIRKNIAIHFSNPLCKAGTTHRLPPPIYDLQGVQDPRGGGGYIMRGLVVDLSFGPPISHKWVGQSRLVAAVNKHCSMTNRTKPFVRYVMPFRDLINTVNMGRNQQESAPGRFSHLFSHPHSRQSCTHHFWDHPFRTML